MFGLIPEIPTRGQLADEAFERFVATQPTFRPTSLIAAREPTESPRP